MEQEMGRYEGQERRCELQPWHLNKGFAITLIFAILANTGSFIWYGAKLDSRVQDTTIKIDELRTWREKQEDRRVNNDALLAALNQKMSDEADVVKHISDLLEKHAYGKN